MYHVHPAQLELLANLVHQERLGEAARDRLARQAAQAARSHQQRPGPNRAAEPVLARARPVFRRALGRAAGALRLVAALLPIAR
jgi:hypothetical protein